MALRLKSRRRDRMRPILAFLMLGFTACAHCGAPAPPDRLPPRCDDLARNDMPRNDMPRNDMPRNDMPRNGLTGAALHQNEKLLQNLAERPFHQALEEAFKSNLIPLATIDDPYATRKLLKYIAACALDPCEKVTAGTAANNIELYGELGLCGDEYNSWLAPRPGKERPWRLGPPTEGCKQRVSACVLARVNAIGASVRLSMRGDGISLAKQVDVDTMFRENHGTDIVSFKTCKMPSDDPHRNCGWVPRHVGRCVPGDVTIRAAGRIRVCAGVYGCDDKSDKVTDLGVDATGAPLDSPPRYGGAMLASGDDTVTIQCPGNGPLLGGKQTGYFAVMVDASKLPQVKVTQVQDPLAEYPASEAAAFTYREGAFYGNLFEPKAVESSPERILWNDQYACYSDVWNLSQALLADRLCANATGAKCFGNTPGPCTERCTALPGNPRVEDVCSPPPPPLTTQPKPAPKVFEPYTVYLNHPCDLATNYELCVKRLQEIH